MKILILGDMGQIGNPLRHYLEKQGHEVVGFDKKRTWYQDLSWVENYDGLCEVLGSVDKCIFLAFEVGGSKFLTAQDKEFSYIQENVMLMANTFKALRETQTPFLFASSQMANMHHTNYGFLKDLGERYCRTMPDQSTICRFWNVYGQEDADDPKAHVITDFIHMAQTTGKITARTNGKERRQFLHVDDCCRGIDLWVKDKWEEEGYLDITSFEWVPVRQLGYIIQDIIPGTECYYNEVTDTIQRGIQNDPEISILKYWRPEISLYEGIKRLL